MNEVYKITREELEDIADSIRDKTGKNNLMMVSEMPTEIASISGEGGGGGSTILNGTSDPANAIGANGDIYLKTNNSILEAVTFQIPVTMQLDYYCNENSVIEFDCSLPSPTNAYDTPFGSRVGSQGLVDHFIAYNGGILRYSFSGTAGNVGDISEYYNKRIKITLSRTYCKMEFEDSEVYNVSFNGGTSTGTVKLGLFSLFKDNNGNDLEACRSNGTFYGMKIYENGILVRDYVPYFDGSVYCIINTLSDDIFYPLNGALIGTSVPGGDTYNIVNSFVKVNSEWQSLNGSDINDVNIAVSGTGISILTGATEPSASIGSEGDFYVQYCVAPDLPEGYTPLKYIEVDSAAGPYIDTGLTCSPNISCEISLQLTNTPTNDTWFYGTYTNSYGFATLGFYHDRMEGYIGDLSGGGAIQIFDKKIHTYTIDLNGISVDGVLKQTGKWNLVATTNPIYLFARHGDLRVINNTRIFYCKQWDNGVLVRHFIPAKRNSDDVIGMLDIVNNVFYTNRGSRSFIGQVCTDNEILSIFVKDNSTWKELIGTVITDIDSTGTWTMSDDYNNNINKPSINSVTLIGNKTNEDLGIQTCIYDETKDEVYTIVDGIRVILASNAKFPPLIPVMTSVNQPSGLVETGNSYGYGQYGRQNIWNAFDHDTSTYIHYNSEKVSDGWVSYTFDNVEYVSKIVAQFGNYTSSNSISASLYVYDENDTEIFIKTYDVTGYDAGTFGKFEFTVNRTITKFKFVFGYKDLATNIYTYDIQAYGDRSFFN